MPQAPRKDPATQRAQDKETKRARGALSCAECRRLKLKCDKTVPCSSCKRRGCSAICPNGSLITGQGTRFVLADTQKLHEKIAQMSDRIRQLEDALSILHSSTESEHPHPLLDRESLKIKSIIELHAAVHEDDPPLSQEELDDTQYIDAFGTLALRDDGANTFYGRSAGSESLLIRGTGSTDPSFSPSIGSGETRHTGLPSIVRELSNSFPLAPVHMAPGVDLDYLISNHLPSWTEASRLVRLYMESAPWFFCAVSGKQLSEEVLPLWYEEAPPPPQDMSSHSPPSLSSPVTSSAGFVQATPVRKAPHELALLYMVFCFGALTDVNTPPENALSERYYVLTKVALNLEPILERAPSVSTVQTLAMMAIYEGLRSGENSIESTWAIMGIATKLAQSIGLHRDCARWKLPPAEVQKRRALFWELFITDGWQSLATGRLATFSLPFVDCELPQDLNQTMDHDGNVMSSFPYWKARFGSECVAPVVQGTLTSRAPKYSVILELDRKVRDMELPKYAQGSAPENAGLGETMSYFMPFNYRHLTLLYIHRCFFTHAISTCPEDPIKSPYAPSFLAGYRSACDLLGSVKKQFTMFPQQIAKFWVLWTHAFSSTVLIASVVTNAPKCRVAPAALLELGTACDLFESAASHGGRAVKFLPIVQRLRAKAQKVYYDTISGMPPAGAHDIFRASPDLQDDEMSIFGGRTNTVQTRTHSGVASASSPSINSRASSDSPKQPNTVMSSTFAGAHPMLVQELGRLDTDIKEAYNRADHVMSDSMVYPSQHANPTYAQGQGRQSSIRAEFPHAPQYMSRSSEQQLGMYRDHYDSHRPPQPGRLQISPHHQPSEPSPSYSLASPLDAPSRGLTMPAADDRHSRRLSHSHSQPNLQQQYEHQQRGFAHQNGQGHTESYSLQGGYNVHQHRPSEAIPSTSNPSTRTQYETMIPPSSQNQQSQQYWNTQVPHISGTSYNDQQRPYANGYQHQQLYPPHYPDMKGMAAEDNSLQETWTSYMTQVASPRRMIGD